MTSELSQLMQRRIAQTAIGANTTRGQREGLLREIRHYLENVSISEFSNASGFKKRLDEETKKLQKKADCSFGMARKCLNLFLRGCCYNHYLREKYSLGLIEEYLEIPLDSFVMGALRRGASEIEGISTLQRCSIAALTPKISEDYQNVALRIAQKKKISRVHLDLSYWRPEA
jgi:hypothetical protein